MARKVICLVIAPSHARTAMQIWNAITAEQSVITCETVQSPERIIGAAVAEMLT